MREFSTSGLDDFADLFVEKVSGARDVLVYASHFDPDSVAGMLSIKKVCEKFAQTGLVSMGVAYGARDSIFPQCSELVRMLEQHLGVMFIEGCVLDSTDLLILVDSNCLADSRQDKIPTGLLPDIIIDHHKLSHSILTNDGGGIMLRDESVGAMSILAYMLAKKLNIQLEPIVLSTLALGTYVDTISLLCANEVDLAVFEQMCKGYDAAFYHHVINWAEASTPTIPFEPVLDTDDIIVSSSGQHILNPGMHHCVAQEADLLVRKARGRVAMSYSYAYMSPIGGTGERRQVTVVKLRSPSSFPMQDFISRLGVGGGCKRVGNGFIGGIVLEGFVNVLHKLKKQPII